MKTLKRNNEIKRVSDSDALFLVKNGWQYCPKSLWKEKKGKKSLDIELTKESDNMSDKKKKKMRKENKRKKYENK